MSDFLAKVTAQLDTRTAEGQMTSFLKDRTMKVKVDLDTGNVNISNFLNQIKTQFQNAGQSAGQNMANAINSSLGSINTKNSEYTLKNLQRTLAAFKFDRSQINTITQSLDSMDLAVQKVETRIREGGRLNLKVTGIDELGRSVTVLKEFDQASGTLRNVGKNISQSFSEVSNAGKTMFNEVSNAGKTMFNDLDVSKLNASMSALDANFVKLKGSINAESTELQRLKQELANISQIQGLDNQQAAFERITLRVNQLSASYKTAKAEATSAAAAQQLMTGKTVLGNQIVTWMNHNTKAAKIYGNELKVLQSQLQAVSNGSQLKNVAQGFREIKTTAAAAGNLGKSVFGQLIGNMTKLSPLFGMGTAITTSIRTVKNMVSTVYELDTALVDLKKTTTMSDADLESFYNGANNVAKQMGVTTAEIINQASAWSRLGYSSKDAAESMAKLSSQFAAISPGMDVDSATDGLVSVMKAYGIEVDDVLDGIMSKINIIGNTAATSNAGIVEMLTRSSSAMSEANNSLEETIALETAAVEITQDAASVGTAYKTVAMRIRGYDEETQSYTNNIEELSGKIADLTKTASTPGGISLFTDDTKTEFKSTYQLLEEISNIYDQLTDKDQAALLEALAGKRQGQIIAATLKNFDAAREAMDNMAKSAGSADREMSVIQESLEYKVNALKETGTGIAQNLFKKEDMKAVVDFGTGVLGVIEAITDKLGLFGTIGATAGITALIKNFSALKTLFSDLGSGEMIKAFEAVKNIQNWANGATGMLNPSVVQQYTAALEGMSLQQVKLVLSTQNLTAAQQAQILNALGLVASEDAVSAALASEAMAQAGLSNETRALVMAKAGLTTATSTCTAAELEQALATQGIVGAEAEAVMAAMGLSAANSTATFSFTALASSIGAATKAIIAFLTTNPIGWAILAGTAIVGVATAFKKHNQAVEEARQVAQTAAGTFQDSTKSVDDYATRIQELSDKLSSGTLTDAEAYEAKKELLSIQNELKESYGEQAAGIDLLNGKLDEQISKVRALSKEEANEYLNKNLDTIQKAEKELNKTLGGDGNFMLEAGKVLGMFNDDLSDEAEKIKEIAAKYKDNIQLDDMGDGQIRVRFVGDAEDATTVLNDFMTDIRNAEGEIENTAFMDSLFNGAGDVVNEADEIIEKYKDIYDAAQKARLIADEKDYNYGGKSESAAKWLNDYAEAVQKYNDALLSGDTTKISQAKNEFQAIDTAIQVLLKQDGFSEYASMFEEIRSQLDETSAAHKEFENELSGTNLDDNSKSLKDYVNTLKSVDGGLTDINFADRFLEGLGEDEVSQAIQAIIDAYADLGLISTDPTQDEIEGLANTLVKAGVLIRDSSTEVVNDIKEISEIIHSEAISDAVSEYTSKISILKDAQEEYNKTGKLSASTTKDLYENISDASDYSHDLAGSLDDMIKAADTDVMAAFNDEIEKLQKAGDYSGADALRQYAQSVIESASEIEGAYQRIGKLKIETPQMQAVEEASSTDNGGKIYEDMFSRYESIKDLYKNGLTGTDDFKSFAAMISPTGSDDVANFEENMGKFERYFTESSKGCQNFLADLKELGYAEQDGSKWTYNLGNNMMELKAAAEQMGIGFEPFMAMFGRLEDYGAYNDFFVTEEQGTQHLSDLYGDLAKEKMRLAEIEANPNTSDYDTAKQESLDKIAEYEERIAKTKESINNLDATNAEYMKEKAEYSKNVAQSMLDEINATSDATLKQSLIDQLDAFAEEYHLKINYDTGSITNLEEAVENIDFKVNLDATGSDLDEQISGLSSYLAQLREGGEIGLNASKISDAEALLSYLVEKKQQLEQPAVMGIDSSQLDNANDKIASAITAIQNFQSAYNQLQEAQALGLDTSEAEANIQNAKSELDSIDESTQKVLNFEVNGDDDVESIIDKIQNLDLSALDTSVQNLSYHFEIDNQDELDAVVDKINNLPKDTQNVTVVLNTDQVDDTKLSSLTTALNSLPKGTESITVTLNMDEADTGKLETINSGLSKISQTHPNTTVVVNGGEAVTTLVDIQGKLDTVDSTHPNPTISADDQASSTISSVSSQLTNLNGKTVHTYVFTHHISSGKSEAQGNAKVHGNAKAQGNARAFGYKGEPKDTVALTGELKPELVVRGDKFFTVGDNGAEMVHLKKGDIVFDGEQTEDILTKGHTNQRGKALAEGNARVGGIDWNKSGNNGGTGSNGSGTGSNGNGKVVDNNTDSIQNNTDRTNENTESTEESTETFDLVKRKLDKFARNVELISNKITDYISSALKTTLLKKQMTAIEKQIEANQTGYNTYMEKANAIGLSKEYRDLIINGSFKIEDIDTSTDSGKKLAEDIKDFESYYDSAIECKDKIQELNNTLLELYDTLANMPTEKAEKKIEKLKRKYESLSSVSDTISLGGSALSALTKQINEDNPKLATAQTNVTKAETARTKTKATRSTASKALQAAKSDTTQSGVDLKKTAKEQTTSIAKNLKKATKSSTDKATYNALSKAIREGKSVSTKGLKGEALKYAKSYNKSLKQQDSISKAVDSGKAVSTSGMSKVLKAEVAQYNQDVKDQAAAQKAYDKARAADEKALEKLNKAKATKDEVYSQTTKEQQTLATNKSSKTYVVQNKLLDQELSLLKSENSARQTALKEINAEVKKQQAEYDKAVASRDKYAKSLLSNKSVTSALNKTQLVALKAGKTVSTKGITDPAVLKKIEAYNKKVTNASDLNKKLNIQLEAQADAVKNAAQAEAEYAQMLVENEKKKLENISNYYESMLPQFENRNSLLQTYMDRMQTRGYNLSTGFYEAQIANQKQIANKQKAELAALQKSFQDALDNDRIQVGTQEYYEMQDSIEQVTMSIAETTNNIVELEAAIRDLNWEQFDRLQESISRITSESDFLIDLMSYKDMYDKEGKITEQGLATMGLHGVNYNTYMAQADKYKEEMLRISEELAEDPYNQKLIDRKNELIDAQQKSILSAEAEKQAIFDLVENGIEAELDSLQDLIDKYIEAIENEKELYDYQKKIRDKSEEIASLQKRLASLQGDNSEETKAQVQELKVSLKNAQEDLEETQYERYITEQKKLLDNFYNDYETILNKRMDDTDALLNDIIAEVNNGASEIQQTIASEAKDVGYTLSNEMETIWSATNGVSGAISAYNGNFTSTMTGINTAIGNVYTRQREMIDAIKNMTEKYIQKVEDLTKKPTPVEAVLEPGTEDSKADDTVVDTGNTSGIGEITIGKVETGSSSGNSSSGATLSTTPKKPTSTQSTSTGDGVAKVGDVVTFNSGKYYAASDGTGASGNSYLGKKVKITRINSASWAKYPYCIVSADGKTSLGWVKLSQLKGYASGIKSVPDDELGWTQELGSELIFRPSENAMLTSLKSGDMVLDHEATENIWKLANDPSGFLNGNILDSASIIERPSRVDNTGNCQFGDINITIPIDHVQDYSDFMKKMQSDKNAEKLIRAMTIDQMAGKSSLRKRNVMFR